MQPVRSTTSRTLNGRPPSDSRLTLRIADSAPPRDASIDWERAIGELNVRGYATVPALLSPRECALLTKSYDIEGLYSSHTVAADNENGRGEHKYFAYPLPLLIANWRTALYARLRELANRWNETMNVSARYPYHLTTYLERCHRAGQRKPTSYLAQFGENGFSWLRQESGGKHTFPLRTTVLLSKPQRDFRGGEFILLERRRQMPWRATVVPLEQGDAVVFASNKRPVPVNGKFSRLEFSHGIGQLHSGFRRSLDLVFHDCK